VSDAPPPELQISSLALAVLLLEPGLTIRSVNPAAEQLVGMGAKRLRGKNLREVATFGDERFYEFLGRGDSPITAHSVQVQFGERGEKLLDLTLSPIVGHHGWQLLSMQDVGTEAAMSERGEAPLRAPAVLAHEIKNPLSAIRGAAQLLSRKVGEAEQAMTTMIADEVDRIAKLVDRMQSLGREQIDPVSPLNLHEVLRRAMSVFSAAGGTPVKLVEEFDPSLPPVLGNEDALVQVLINLMSNARDACSDFTDEPQIELRTRFVSGIMMNAIRLGRPVRLPIEIRVSDNGPGIDPALADHIFEPFVSSKKNGQGLGLALVHKLVRDMNGRISHERDEAEGRTHFRIHLPMAK
jgi:two-component system nitrogen regulation sensor histidine kinase GlnL